MKIAGNAVLDAPVGRVWDAILSPEVLVCTIPGCERLEVTGDNTYAMTVTAGVASIKGTYKGTCELRDLKPHTSLLLKAQGAGSAGTIGVDVVVQLEDNADGTTRLSYDADAVVGGMVGGVGQRMLTSVSKRMAAQFFAAINDVLNGTDVPALAPADVGAGAAVAALAGSAAGRSFSAPAQSAGARGDDFVKGVLVGAGLVLAGVFAGALASRRRG